MEPAMGMYELTSQRRTPTTIKTSTTWIKGMIYSFIGDLPADSFLPGWVATLSGFWPGKRPTAMIIIIPREHR
jgi:hypothetical protein